MGLNSIAAGRLAVAARTRRRWWPAASELFPKAARNLLPPPRYRRLDGTGHRRRRGHRSVGRSGDGGLPVRAVRGPGGVEPGPRARSIRALLDLSPTTAERIGPAGASRSSRPPGCGPAIACWCGRATRSRSTARSPRASRAWIRRRSPASRCRCSRAGGPGVRRDGQRRGDAGNPGAGPVSDALISRVVAQVRASQSGRADRAADLAVRRRVHADGRGPVAPGHDRPAARLGRDRRARVGLEPVPRMVRSGAGRAGDRLPVSLVIATPVAVVSGLAAAARRAILIRGGEYLEEVGRLRALAFDKTGP